VPLSVLLTGYEPWNDFVVNSSWEAAKEFDGRLIAGARVTAKLLPVSYTDMPPLLHGALSESQPAICLGLGMEPPGSKIRLERVAVNLADAGDYPDNDGSAPRDTLLLEDTAAPSAYFSSLPLRTIAAKLGAANIPWTQSLTAGAFLCNAAFFHTMHAAATTHPSLTGGFIHVPPIPGTPAAPEPEHGMELAQIIEAVEIAIETTVAALTPSS
jgi:pyroglutamyl-peptidase